MTLRRRPDRESRPDGDEHGYVILWMVIVLVLLLSVAAFSVDLVHAYVEGDRAQKAADAGALAGAVSIPTDHSGGFADSLQRARDLTAENGFTDGSSADVTPTVSGVNQMTVKVTAQVPTFFANIMGIPRLDVTKKAVAEYDPPTAMGSPANNLGDVPYCPADVLHTDSTNCLNLPPNSTQKLWANVQGPEGGKTHGNVLSTENCNDQYDSSVADVCTGSSNDEFDDSGESFKISSDGIGPIDVWIYDAAFIATQPDCTVIEPANSIIYATGTDGEKRALENYNVQKYCAGDSSFSIASPGSDPVTTQYDVTDPSGDPVGGCPLTLPGFGLVAGDTQLSGGTGPGGEELRTFTAPQRAFNAGYGEYFHQWHKLCSIASPDAGEYTLHASGTEGMGNNQFSILVMKGALHPPGLSVFTRGSLPLLADSAGGTSTFYLARVLPSSRDRQLQVDFFDLGDNGFSNCSGPGTPCPSSGTLTVTTKNTTGAFSGATADCSYVPPPVAGGSRTFDEIFAGPYQSAPGCSLSYAADVGAPSTWNGRWVSLRITIPSVSDPTNAYNCVTTSLENCWIQLQILPADGKKLTDATTWRAAMRGAPVRLVG